LKVAGVEACGLGSDFDGANISYGMKTRTKLRADYESLLKKGYSEGDVRKFSAKITLGGL